MAPLKGTLVKTFYLRPRREVQSYYTVCPLGSKSEELDKGSEDGSDNDMSGRSLNSARSRDSHDSRRRRRHNSGAGSVASATTPRSRGGRERYHSPAELSPRATKEFENVLKSTCVGRRACAGVWQCDWCGVHRERMYDGAAARMPRLWC